MNEEMAYIKELGKEELVNIILNIWGFEETTTALLQLTERDPDKALELGIDILENDKGDDYLQATVWDMIFDINPITVIKSLADRDKSLGKTLLHDVLEDLNIEYHYKNLKGLSLEFTKKLKLSFDLLDKDIQCGLSEEYNEFIRKISA